jgi:hypothetical protein
MNSCAKCKACTDFFAFLRAPSRTDNVVDIDRLIGYLGTRLKTEPEPMHSIYNESLDAVRKHISRLDTSPPADINLDTNLPSRGGQYQCADAAFQQAITKATAGSPSTAVQSQALKSLLGSFNNYQATGKKTRQFFTAKLRGSLSDPLLDATTKPETDDSLFDLLPIANSSGVGMRVQLLNQCSARVALHFDLGGQQFQLDPTNNILCVPSGIPRLEFIFGYASAVQMLQSADEKGTTMFRVAAEILSKNERRYKEALDRLRIDEKVGDQFLYPAGNCAGCQ